MQNDLASGIKDEFCLKPGTARFSIIIYVTNFNLKMLFLRKYEVI